MRKLIYQIEEKDHLRTVEDFLSKDHAYSKRMITKIKRNKEDISCNGSHIRMVDPLHTGDTLAITLSEDANVLPNSSLTVPIVYEDEDIIVYNKPPFMPVHPSSGHLDDTLANVYCAHMKHLGISAKFHPINRLDRDTSGLCVIAKNPLATSKLANSIEKEYTAIVCGRPEPPTGRIDAPIMRVEDSIIKRCVGDAGQRAVTNYTSECFVNNYTLVRIKLETGRTHQIRVHFAHIGYPLAGDSMYGGDMTAINRQALCCNKVSFIHPIMNNRINLSIDIQLDMYNLVQNE